MALINLDTKESISSSQIKKFSELTQIPFISSTYTSNDLFKYSLDIQPVWGGVSQAFIDLISFVKWNKFILLYEDSSGNLKKKLYKNT